MNDWTKLIGTLVGYTIGVLVANGIIMWVYNMVVPDVFGLKPIGLNGFVIGVLIVTGVNFIISLFD